MSSLFNGNNIILDEVEKALIGVKGSLSIDFAKIKYFSQTFKKNAGSGYQVSKDNIGTLIRKTCNDCNIIGKDPDVIVKILKG